MADQSLFGAFIPTTQQYDISHIMEMDVSSPEFKDFLVRMRQYINNIALVLNIKDSGYYLPSEFVNGQLWFADPTLSAVTPNSQTPTLRQDFRIVVNFGALPNNTSKSVAHNIPAITTSSTFSITRSYAAASDTTSFAYIPIPYASTTGNTVELSMDATNVTITTTSDRTNFDTCYVVIEYLRH